MQDPQDTDETVDADPDCGSEPTDSRGEELTADGSAEPTDDDPLKSEVEP